MYSPTVEAIILRVLSIPGVRFFLGLYLVARHYWIDSKPLQHRGNRILATAGALTAYVFTFPFRARTRVYVARLYIEWRTPAVADSPPVQYGPCVVRYDPSIHDPYGPESIADIERVLEHDNQLRIEARRARHKQN